MRRSHWINLGMVGFLLASPFIAHAASTALTSIIPGASSGSVCLCPGSAPDWGCVLQTLQNIMNDVVGFAAIIISLFIAQAGFTYMTSSGNPEKRQLANKRMLNAVLGLVIALSAWLLVDSIMKVLYNPNAPLNGSTFGPWNSILVSNGADYCIKQQTSPGALAAIGQITQTSTNPGGGTLSVVSGGGVCSASAGQTAAAAVQYQNQVCADANADGISGQCNQLLGILAQESGGNPTVQSSAGAIGLMQLEPDTAGQYGVTACSGSSRSNPSAACVAALDDPSTNIAGGVQYYASLYNQNNGNSTFATAGYNGGQGANKPSVTCPGQTQWQCTANPGYAQTRNYVTSVSSLASTIGADCT